MTPARSRVATPLAESTSARPATERKTALLALPPPRSSAPSAMSRKPAQTSEQAGSGVGHRCERRIEGVEHGPFLLRGRAGCDQRDPGEQQDGHYPLHHAHSQPSRSNHSANSSAVAGVCWTGSGSGSGFGTASGR